MYLQGDEHELPLGIFGMKMSFTRPTEKVAGLWEQTAFPKGQTVMHTEHGHGTVAEVVDSGRRVIKFDSGEHSSCSLTPSERHFNAI